MSNFLKNWSERKLGRALLCSPFALQMGFVVYPKYTTLVLTVNKPIK